MKFSAAVSLAMAPVVLAKSVHNVYPVRRDSHNNKRVASPGIAVASIESTAEILVDPLVLEEVGIVLGSLSQVNVIWFNQGGNAATTTIQAPAGAQATSSVGEQQVAPPPPAVSSVAAAAQSLPPLAAASGTVAATGALQTHQVMVGGEKGLIYEPESIVANVGDMVVFTFMSTNHTATQSAFTSPCERLASGMDTGFQPNPNNTVNPPPQVAMQVMVSTPLWFYCRQKGHCGKGMTFSINPTAAKTQAMFQQMAIAQNGTGTGSAITGNGGGAPPAAGGSSVAGVSSAAAATGTLAALPGESTALGGDSTGTASLPAGTGVVSGSGTLQGDGSCSCFVQCASGSFPAVQAQGLGSFGGMPGALPSSMAAVR